MFRLFVFSTFINVVGCGTESEPISCVEAPTACTPLYEPTFDNIHSRTIVPGCAISGGSCHEMAAGSGGFTLLDIEAAHGIMATQSADAECGVLLTRLHAPDPTLVMPPGKRLSDGELCAITQWVQAGSPR